MNVSLARPDVLAGTIKAPPSKSETHRVIVASAMDRASEVLSPLYADSTEATRRACIALGATIRQEGQDLFVDGFKGQPRSGGIINVGNSGTTMRLTISLASLCRDGKTTTIIGDSSLSRRPNGPLVAALRELGVDIKGQGTNDTAPVTVKGNGLKGGNVKISVSESSQYVSSLLMACPCADSDTTIDVIGAMSSKPYIEMTLELLKQYHIEIDHSKDLRHFYMPGKQQFRGPKKISVKGDYSQAAFFLAAGSLFPSEITVENLYKDRQGDRKFLDILTQMGVKLEIHESSVSVKGPYHLEGIDVDLGDTPDLFPITAVLGAFASGRTKMYNMPQIRYKESDRIAVMKRELERYGARVEEGEDYMTVYGLRSPNKQHLVFDPKDPRTHVADHRVEMSLSILALASDQIWLGDSQCISISYPGYFEDLQRLGVEVHQNEHLAVPTKGRMLPQVR
ncbi:MAG: 3-phosphoshikimate 1-carboxyvinyltransferase [Thaumarchaeota archaeon]|nr:3-phosphoshikimate 1-carboxyvinyltransferase [Nitrososphaerota archaeon]